MPSPPRRLFLILLSIPALFVFLLYLTSRSTAPDLVSTSTHSFELPDEIFGVLHFVTSPDEAGRIIIAPGNPSDTSDVPHENGKLHLGGPVHPEEPVELTWYALGAITKAGGHRRAGSRAPSSGGWDKRLRVLREDAPLVVFSKSYCPYSKRAKKLLEMYDVSPPPKIVEVDLRADSAHIKTLLARLTHQNTFPNVILHGRSLGGSDDLIRLHEEDRLRQVLEEGGLKVRWTGEGGENNLV